MWLEIQDVCKSFGGVQALRGIRFDHRKDEILGVLGPNGSGKSTLFDSICGLTHPESGYIKFDGRSLVGMMPHEVARQGVARCFQMVRLARRLSILENLVFSLISPDENGLLSILSGYKPELALQTKEGVKWQNCLETYGLWDDPNQLAGTLSYGQQKLLSIVCCAARNASLFLLDEPASGVSSTLVKSIVEVLKSLRAQGSSIIVIEHDMDVIEALCDRVMYMNEGRVVFTGSLEDLRSDPRVMDTYSE